MKVVLIALSAVVLAGCSSPKILGMEKPAYMQRQEVINAVRECESGGLRAQVVYTYIRKDVFGHRSVAVPIDVHCHVNHAR